MEQIRFEEYLTVGDGDDIGRDVSGDIARLRLDDGQCGHAAAACLVAETSCTLEKSRVQVEYIAGVCFSSGRSLKQQRKLTVSGGLLAEVVVYNEDISALVHEVFAHCSTGVGCDVQHGCRLGCVCGDDDGIIHCAEAAQLLHHTCDGGLLLTYGNIDADDILALLIDDSIKGDRGLTGLAVADNKLTLTAADGNKCVDSLETRLHRYGNGLSVKHAGCGAFHGAELLCLDGTLAVDGLAHCVNDTADHAFADGHFDYTAGTADGVALLNVAERSEQDDADILLIQILNHALEAARELEHLACHAVGKAGHTADTVADGDDLAGLEHIDAVIDLGKLLLDALGDILHLLIAGAAVVLNILAEAVKLMDERTVINGVADLHLNAADKLGIDLIVAGYEGLADYLRELLHLLVAQRLCALY